MNQQPYLPRRTFLKGMGVAVSLPMLEAMLPARLRAAEAAKAPTRMAFVSFPNGCVMSSWKPEQVGAQYTLPPTLQPLADVQSDFNVITGLAQDNGRPKGDGPGDHARSAASLLTGAHPVKTSGANIKVGISVDQVAASEVGQLTKLPSLEIGIEGGRNAGNCDSGYSCAYSSNISWRSETTPMAKEINPRLVFERMFGSPKMGPQSGELRSYYRKSILDLVAEDARKLQQRVGQTDRRKLDEYFSSVREIEQQIERAEQHASSQQGDTPTLNVPAGIPRDLAEHIRLMYDLMALAFRTDTTRIATFMLANEGSNRTYPMVEVNDGHHELSHHQKNEEKLAKLQRIDQFLIGEFAYFLGKLKSIPEGEGSLLDNCMILYASGLSDGDRHNHDDLPCLLAGRAGGTIQTGRHIKFDVETPMNNLFLSMLDRMNAQVEKLGDSSGRLAGLEG